MREVFVYVEGPSDQSAMRSLLAAPRELAATKGFLLDFYPLRSKKELLNKGPLKALNILRNRADSCVFLVPDLYPRNVAFPHSTYQELKSELESRFMAELRRKGAADRLMERFRVHCFKHDLEVLLLASEGPLMQRLNVKAFSRKWANPVEDQNHDHPPKRVVEGLFSDSGMTYKDTVDAPWVLERSDYRMLQDKCSQNFKPFLKDLFEALGLPSLMQP